MLDSFQAVIEKGGILAGLAVIGLSVLRAIGMRASKDAVTLKGDHSDRDSFNRLMQRVDHLDRRLDELESIRNHLFGFVTKCMTFISRCAACDTRSQPDREELEKAHEELMLRLDEHFKERRKEKLDADD